MRSARVALLTSGLVTMAFVLVTSSAGCLNEGGLFINGLDGGPASGGLGPTGGGPGRTGGASTTGGQVATGGVTASGGQVSNTGGAGVTGGAAPGGAGNSATGGKGTGGAATAGHGTGGLATGGLATGGVATGGSATGGTATGGVAMGGAGGGAGGAGCGPTCDLACPQGYVLDSHGCPTCMCKPPICPALKCTAPCPYGAQKDANGCDTCTCLPPPACSAADCGAKPNAPIFDCPRNGQTATHCARKDDGTCAWFFDGCTGGTCGALTCESACLTSYARGSDGCTTCTCSGATACDTCFGGGGPTTTCDDGTPAGYICERYSFGGVGSPGGTCSLVSRSCPVVTSSSTCSRITTATACAANDSCIWLDAGCKPPALGATGCYARREMGCTSDNDCGGSRICVQRNVNPCVGTDPAHCASCAVTVSLCLAP